MRLVTSVRAAHGATSQVQGIFPKRADEIGSRCRSMCCAAVVTGLHLRDISLGIGRGQACEFRCITVDRHVDGM